MSAPDPELAGQGVIPSKGFATVASKVAYDPDKSTAIYRRFDALSTRNLLFYQAELAELESLQRQYDTEDAKERDELSVECMRDWSSFVRNTEEGRERERKRMELAMKIRDKLEKYHAALVAHRTLLNSRPPSSSTVKALRNWFFDNTTGKKGQDKTPQLWGASETIYDDIHDLVALRVPADQDRLSEFIQNNFGVFFQISTPDNRQTYISERSISCFVAFLSTVLASILLFVSIISLSLVQNKKVLLGMLSGWTILFAACVGLLTNARRDQIFGSTAAYAAVLVVFISGNLGASGEGWTGCVNEPA